MERLSTKMKKFYVTVSFILMLIGMGLVAYSTVKLNIDLTIIGLVVFVISALFIDKSLSMIEDECINNSFNKEE